MRRWNIPGRADHLKKIGDYFTVELVGVPLIIVRDAQGALKAFVNSCRHRGARLLSGQGNRQRKITCPYHAWVYSTDGKLLAARGMDGTAGFQLGDYGLRSARGGTWGGFLFVHFDAGAASLAEPLGEVPAERACYDLAHMVTGRRNEYRVRGNWQLL